MVVIDIFSLLVAWVLAHKGVGVGGNVLGSEGSFEMQRQLGIDAPQGHDLRRVTPPAMRQDTKGKFLLPCLLATGLQDPKSSGPISRTYHVDVDGVAKIV